MNKKKYTKKENDVSSNYPCVTGLTNFCFIETEILLEFSNDRYGKEHASIPENKMCYSGCTTINLIIQR